MSLEINQTVTDWISFEVLPNIQMMVESRIASYPPSHVEYWNNVVIRYVLQSVVNKFNQRQKTKNKFKKIMLHEAEAVCLYRSFLSYPIEEKEFWKVQQMQFLIAQLDKMLKNVVT